MLTCVHSFMPFWSMPTFPPTAPRGPVNQLRTQMRPPNFGTQVRIVTWAGNKRRVTTQGQGEACGAAGRGVMRNGPSTDGPGVFCVIIDDV